MKLKPSELVIITRMEKYPLPLEGDNASLKRWRSFSPHWWGIMQGLLEGLLQPILWDEWSDELRDEIVKHFIPETVPDCTEPPPPAPPPAPPSLIAGGVGEQVGITGLTYDELEDFFMSWSLRNQLAYVDGKLHYWAEGCCAWQPIETISGVAPVGSIGTASELTYEAWEILGSFPTPDIENLGNDDSGLLVSDDSAKCAKATAIIEQIWQTMETWVDVAGDFDSDITTSVGFASLITSWFPLVSIPLGIIGTIFAFFLGGSTADIITRLSAAIAKTDEKQDLICDLVPRMATPKTLVGLHLNRMTDNDIAIAFTRFQDIVAPHADVVKLLKFFPVTEWKQITAERAETEGCGCDDFLPYQYVPPSQAGSLQFENLVYTGAINAAPLSYLAGQPFELLESSNPHGQTVISGSSWRSVYSGADTQGGQNNKYTRAGILVKFPELLTVESILYDVGIVGTPAGAVWQALQAWVAVYSTGAGWSSQNIHAEAPLVDDTDLGGDVTLGAGTYLVLAWRTVNTDANLYAILSNIRFTGTINGQGFLNKMIGEPLT